MTMGIMGSGLAVSAETETIFFEDGMTYKYDLNKDGKNETIECIYNYGGKDILYINGKKALSAVSKNSEGYCLMDINEEDRYLEIFGRSKYSGKSVFYRYNGKKLNTVATGLHGDGKIFKNMPAEIRWWIFQPGNGVYNAYMALGGFSASQGYGGYIPVKVKFRKVGKKMTFWANAEHELLTETTDEDGEVDYSIVPRASGTMTAYNKPALKGVSKAFILEKGDRYTYLSVKFSLPYSFIQIEDLKTEKTGWVVVKTSALKLAPDIVRTSKPVEEDTPLQKKEQTITVNKIIEVKTYGKGETFNLGARAAGKLTYKISNPKVAVISAAGVVKITGVGKAVITVNAAATAEYEAATETVQLTVEPGIQLISVTSEKKGYLSFRWERNSLVNGYEINYSPNKLFDPLQRGTTKNNLITDGSVGGLVSGQIYFVRVRGFNLVNGIKVYGPWSAVKYYKVK